MRDYCPAIFIDAAGQQYQLLLSFTPPYGQTVMLDIAQVKQLDYQTSLNDLIVRGTLVYTDVGGLLDGSLYEPGGVLKIIFSRMEMELDDEFTIISEFEGGKLDADFLVENAGILERQDSVITYKISFTSINIIDCLKIVDFSNYDKEPEPILDILKQIVANQSGINIDSETFDAVKQQPTMNYITNGNDNLFTVSKFLLDKLYYNFPRAQSMVFIFWNELKNKLQLFDVANKKSITGQTGVVLSMFATQAESMSGGVQNELGVVTKFPTSASLNIGYKKQIAIYDYSKNKFNYDNINPESSYQYMNEHFSVDDTIITKYKNRFLKEQNKYTIRGSYWNNDFHFYGTFIDTFLNNNALLVKTIGNITKQPGSITNITIDRGQKDLIEENPQMYEDILRRYCGLEGTWITAKVHHYIQPNAEKKDRYRQTLTLVRNFNHPNKTL